MVCLSPRTIRRLTAAAIALAAALPRPARAADTLCDPSHSNCRTQLLNLIAAEKVGIDVAFWFMEDYRYETAIVNRFKAGVPVRLLVDPRASASSSLNAQLLASFKAAGIPMRYRTASGILHWKMMLFAGQDTVEFGSANFSPTAFVPVTAYTNYVDETIYTTTDPAVVDSFKTEFDNSWIDTTSFKNYANITHPLVRTYPIFAIDADLNFPPSQNYATRAVAAYQKESSGIDVIMYRITDRQHTDAMIAAHGRGVPIRMIVENKEYRDPKYLWDAWNVDRLYAAGIPLRWRGHAGQNHEKLVLLHGEGMAIFGSSNWTSASASSQQEHNYFTKKSALVAWFETQFNRMWHNSAGATETVAFAPLPPDKPSNRSPANGSTVSSSTSATLKWYGGPWAHTYDVYFGTTNPPPLGVKNQALGPSTSTGVLQAIKAGNLQPHTTYYWKIVSKTMANKTASGSVWSFKTP
jgi:phosphatidylserine/phosphatidylglycerophosphate/cardiolipin synthase-like enzyme